MNSTASSQVDIGFIGLGNIGLPVAMRLLEAGHRLVVFDISDEAMQSVVAHGATAASSPHDVADRSETVMVSLPSPEVAVDVAAECAGGSRIRRLVDLSTIGSQAAQRNHAELERRGIAMLDCPVSGGVHGARNGTLTMMVSGPRTEFDAMTEVLGVLGRAIYVGDQPGAAQTMKLINNLMAATTLTATAEVAVTGVKAGLEANVLIDVLNAGSGATSASRDKFPRSVLPRTFDYGFATGLMVKDIRLYLQEAHELGMPTALATRVLEQWETVLAHEGPDSDFTSVVKPLEAEAGVIVDGRRE